MHSTQNWIGTNKIDSILFRRQFLRSHNNIFCSEVLYFAVHHLYFVQYTFCVSQPNRMNLRFIFVRFVVKISFPVPPKSNRLVNICNVNGTYRMLLLSARFRVHAIEVDRIKRNVWVSCIVGSSFLPLRWFDNVDRSECRRSKWKESKRANWFSVHVKKICWSWSLLCAHRHRFLLWLCEIGHSRKYINTMSFGIVRQICRTAIAPVLLAGLARVWHAHDTQII